MEPVPGTRTVRRTVRVAVALLLGQAVLVAVIGWVTYRYSPAHRHRGAAVVDQMAGAPRVLPPPAVRSSAVVRPSQTSARLRSLRTTEHPVNRAPRSTSLRHFSPPPISAGPSRSPAPTPAQTSASPPLPPAPPAPTASPARPSGSPVPSDDLLPTGPVQQSVIVGELCDPEGAVGRTAGGTDVRCVRGPARQLHWEIV